MYNLLVELFLKQIANWIFCITKNSFVKFYVKLKDFKKKIQKHPKA